MDESRFHHEHWRLHPRVSIRPERFGAMAYHYDNRRLSFLKSNDLVEVVNRLAEHPTARAAFDACDLAPQRWPSFSKALAVLANSDMIVPANQVTQSASGGTYEPAS